MREVDVSAEEVEPPSWLPEFAPVADRVFEHVGRSAWDVRVLLCTPLRIRELNREFRGQDTETDVLTFYDDAEGIDGDIAISPAVVEENARRFGVGVRQESLRVYVHALLHLCGYTHDGATLDPATAADHPMFALQEHLVTTIGSDQPSHQDRSSKMKKERNR